MALVYLVCEADLTKSQYGCRDYERLLHYSKTDVVGQHSIVDNPESADVVIFIGSTCVNFSDIRNSRCYKKHRNKSVVFISGDNVIPLLPGVYNCLESHTIFKNPNNVVAGYYLRVTDNESLDLDCPVSSAQFLFSFLGNASNHKVRRAICEIKDERSLIIDTSSETKSLLTTESNHERYINSICNSKFILCPRGIGVASWRLFETMRAGRCPVIVADNWVRPLGPDWDSFCIFINESDTKMIPSILRNKENLAREYGRAARKEWERCFSKETLFDTTVSSLLTCSNSTFSDSLKAKLLYRRYFEPFFFRHWLVSPLLHRNVFKINK